MYASNCINPEIPFLQPEDKGLTALSLLEELKISEIPIVDNDIYVGLISEFDLLDYDLIEGEIKSLQRDLNKPHIYAKDHLFEAVSTLVNEELTVLPVLTEDDKYVGCIDHFTALKILADAEGFKSPGGVLEMEMAIHDYSMAEISRLVESNDLKIIHSYVNAIPDSKKVQLTLKLNKPDLGRLIKTLERFNYTITAFYQQDEYEEDLKKRYDSFLRYLNI